MPVSKAAILREVRLPEAHPFNIEEISIPSLVKGAVLGRIVMAGICGTDVHILHGKVTTIKLPTILGHENCARVEAISPEESVYDITGKLLKVDDLITWLPKSCQRCYNCTILGDPAKCERRVSYGGWLRADQHPYLIGGFAEYAWLMPDSDIVIIPPDVTPEAVVLGDALRIMVHGLERIGGVEYGDTVVVQGCGAVGLMGLLLARDAGTVPLNPNVINKKQITINGAWSAANKHFLQALTLLRKLPVKKLVTHYFPLENINEALIVAERQIALKAVITP